MCGSGNFYGSWIRLRRGNDLLPNALARGGFDWGERKSVGGRLQEMKDDGPMLGGAMLFTTSSKLNNACHGQHRDA